MKEDDIIKLKHILDAAYEINLYVKDKSRKEIENDRIVTLGLVKEIEIIGEAASQVSQEAKDQIPGIEWKRIISMRNRLVHAYFEIDEDIVWNTIKYNIPKLIEILRLIKELQERK